jgi:hypothetical protein
MKDVAKNFSGSFVIRAMNFGAVVDKTGFKLMEWA